MDEASVGLKPFDEPIYITRPLVPTLKQVTEKLKGVWQSKWLTNHGDLHRELEEKLQVVLKVRNVSVFNNGTTALLTALKALDLPQGSEVITTPFTFPATVHCIAWNGLKPVFCDIEPDTMTIDADKIEELVNKNTSAILGVHVYGLPCDVEKIQKVADSYNLKVIYDAAHAFTAEINGKGIGNYGDISMFSFHATKLFHTAEGGCLSYNDDQYIDKLYYLRNFGIKNEEEVVEIGINGKMNEIQAAIGLLNLDLIGEEKLKRKEIKSVYIKHLALLDGITLLEFPKNTTDSMGYFVVKIDQKEFGVSRNEIYDSLKQYNVFARKYFYPLCSEYEPYKQLKSSSTTNLPVANKIKDEVLCLPFYGGLGAVNAGKICKIIEYIKYRNKISTEVSV
ncbi:MAG: DegT/DnrJ/EryC1/StrS family aminotransferase [Planctomycetota bacterium]|nr:MAG: DegT/DnrJ/EryC1/StrS family aminotransferase [Planctomycetota bacterium]